MISTTLWFGVSTSSELEAKNVISGQIEYNGQQKLSLDGQWEIYWDTLFTELKTELPISYSNITKRWRTNSYPGTGVATHRVIISSDSAYHDLAMMTPQVYTHSAIYLNGRLVSRNKIANDDPHSTDYVDYPELVLIDLQEGSNELIWQISNHIYYNGGSLKAILIGDFQSISNERELRVAAALFLLGCIMILGLFFLGLHLYWRKDNSTLILSLFLLVYGFKFCLHDLYLFLKVFPEFPLELSIKVKYLSIYLGFILFVLFLKKIFEREFHSLVYITLIAFFTLQCVLIITTSVYFFTSIYSYLHTAIFMATIYSLYVVVSAYRNGNAHLLLAIALCITLISIPAIAIFTYLGIIEYYPFAENLGMIGTCLTFSYIMAFKFAESFKNAESLQIKTQEQNDIISKSLQEKELLLGEIHHRVKNNLQTINSLLILQSKSIVEPAAIRAIQESQHRIQSMALVHQKLYQSNNKSLGVDIRSYISELVQSILHSQETYLKIKVNQEVDSLALDLDTVINLGLIINELITNCVKHAFNNIPVDPTIWVAFKQNDDHLMLTVKDNGTGYDPEMQAQKPDAFGLKLIESLGRKLKGSAISQSDPSGTEITFTIKKYKVISHE